MLLFSDSYVVISLKKNKHRKHPRPENKIIPRTHLEKKNPGPFINHSTYTKNRKGRFIINNQRKPPKILVIKLYEKRSGKYM